MKKFIYLLLIATPLPVLADISHSITSSISLTVGGASTSMERIGSSFSISGTGVDVTDGTTVNVGLNSIIYTGTVNNNSAFVNIPSTSFNILTSKVEYVVTGSINNIAQASISIIMRVIFYWNEWSCCYI